MEIQTFFLATKITRLPGNRHDVEHAALHAMDFPPESVFPVRLTFPALMLLRREISSGEAPIRLRFNLVDEDGREIGQPRQVLVEAIFPEGMRFSFFMIDIHFESPSTGQYRLDITTDEGLTEGVYSYGIDITQQRSS